jgi:hypothetical protein
MDQTWEPGRIDPNRVYDLNHARGDACPVIDLLYESFGVEAGGSLLMEFTCFPFSDSHAWEQAKALVKADCAGELEDYLARERAAQEASMRAAAGL